MRNELFFGIEKGYEQHLFLGAAAFCMRRGQREASVPYPNFEVPANIPLAKDAGTFMKAHTRSPEERETIAVAPTTYSR